MIPVYISSKGKLNGDTPTTSLLKAGGREYTIFVEPNSICCYGHRLRSENRVQYRPSGVAVTAETVPVRVKRCAKRY